MTVATIFPRRLRRRRLVRLMRALALSRRSFALGLLLLVAATSAGMAFAQQPDLRFAAFPSDLGTTLGAGETITLAYQVENAGSADAGPFSIAVYYDDDATLNVYTNGQAQIPTTVLLHKADYPGGLAAGTTDAGSIEVTMPAQVLYGLRYLHAAIDLPSVVAESDETNNRRAAAIDVRSRPDLVVSALTVTPDVQIAGAPVSVTATVRNQGLSRTSTSFATRFVYSDDDQILATDTRLGTQDASYGSLLPAGATATVAVVPNPASLPGTAQPGLRYVGAIANATGLVDEAGVTANNSRAAAITVLAAPNLRMKSFAVNAPSATGTGVPSAEGTGTVVTLAYDLENAGDAPAEAFKVRFYYDDDATLNVYNDGNSSYVLTAVVGEVSVPSLAGRTALGVQTVTASLPPVVLRGERRIHYFIDYETLSTAGVISETDETDNRGSTAIEITGQPDLVASAVSVEPASAPAGGTLSKVSASMTNVGKSRTTSSAALHVLYSDDATITTTDPLIANLGNWSSIPVGETRTGTLTANLRVPNAALPGDRFVGAYADPGNVAAESDETNNGRAVAFTVESTANLAMKSFTLATGAVTETGMPSTPGFGSTLQVSYDLQNTGGSDAGSFRVRLYYTDAPTLYVSNDGTPANGPVIKILDDFEVSSVAAGASTGVQTRAVAVPADVLFGTRHVHYFIDYQTASAGGVVPETDEVDNKGFATFDVSGRADFVISALSVTPAGAPAGATVSVTATMTNAGTSRAPSTSILSVRLTEDGVVTSADPVLVTGSWTGTRAGREETIVRSVQIPATTAAGPTFIGAAADFGQQNEESDETNNVKTVPFRVDGGANLRMKSFAIATGTTTSAGVPSALGAGVPVTLSYEVENTGATDASAFRVRFFYMDSSTLAVVGESPANSSQGAVLADAVVEGLPAQALRSGAITVPLPKQVLHGSRYVHYFVDSKNGTGEVAESDEADNKGSVPVEVTGRPNLRVSVFTATPTERLPGDEVDVTYQVENTGASRAPASTMRMYLADNAELSINRFLIGNPLHGVVFAGATLPDVPMSARVRIPLDAVPGPRFLGGRADADAQVVESDEADNATSVQVQVLNLLRSGGFWLKGSDLDLAAGARVADWVDANNPLRKAAQAESVRRPQFVPSYLNGHDVVRFDGTDDNLTLGTDYVLSETGVTFVAVLNSTADRAVPFVFDAGAYPGGHYGFAYDLNTAGVGTPTSFGGEDDLTAGMHSSGRGTFVIYAGRIDLSGSLADRSQSVRVNGDRVMWSKIAASGLTITEIAEAPTRGPASGPTTIGMQATTTNEAVRNLQGDVAELLVFPAPLGDAQVAVLETYLGAKYAVGVSNTPVASVLQNRTGTYAFSGQSAAITLTANGDPDGGDVAIEQAYDADGTVVTASVVAPDGAPVEPNVVVPGRRWMMWNEGLTSVTLTLAVDWTGLDGVSDPTFTADRLVLLSRPGGTESWTPHDTERIDDFLIASGLSISASGGDWEFAVGAFSEDRLPVELVGWSAQAGDGDVVLTWSTASEVDNAGFDVEHRSVLPESGSSPSDSPAFARVAFVPGKGTTNRSQVYRVRVPGLAAGEHVFRLRQVDLDGTASYSPEVTAVVAVQGTYQIRPPSPNPVVGEGRLVVTVAEAQAVRVELFDLLGRRVAVLHDGPVAANAPQSVSIRTDRLASGSYFVRIQGATFRTVERVTVLR